MGKKLIYENGRFYAKNKKGKLIQVDQYGTPIEDSSATWIDPKARVPKKDDSDLFDKTIDAATTPEGMGTIGGAAVGGWLGSSVGIAALGTAVAGTLPIAVVGGAVGYLAVKAFGSDDKKKK